MVSLFHMSTQGLRSDHLDTGISALNQILDIKMDAVLDVQSVPMNPALSAILANLIASHLSKSNTMVVIIETLNPFEWEWLRHHPRYQDSWLEEKRICVYRLDSFAKLFAFFSFMPSELNGLTPVLALIMNFHELIELYRLQLAACYEETLLKHQIDKCNTLLANKEKYLEEGFELIELPSLPKTSSLLRESPFSQFTRHIDSLLLLINAFAYKRSGVVVLQGFMVQSFKPYSQTMDTSSQISGIRNSESSQNKFVTTKYHKKSRLVFTPISIGKENKAGENKISSRLLFYNDWYFKSPHFVSEDRSKQKSDYHLVSVVKVTNFYGYHTINDPIYFDFKQYPIPGTKLDEFDSWFINLLEIRVSNDNNTAAEQQDLSAVLHTSTQHLSRKRDFSSTQLASSPPFRASQLQEELNRVIDYDNSDSNSEHSDARSVEVDIDAYSFDGLVIEGSDVELTGTVFEDRLEPDLDIVEESAWTMRHI